MLVPILFIHELGHYLAMRAFDYRNLKMFFLPFFGAAVTGRHYNVPGWKKAIVSLMGPVPGIVLGAILGALGVMMQQPLLIQIALVALILNGINLLPVLPLDGGWVFHVLVFSRHPLLDAAFRLAAVAALAWWGMNSRDKIMLYLSIPMLLSIPQAYRIARVASALRTRGVATASPDDQSLPPQTAEAIITTLKEKLRGVQPAKMLAQQTLQVFEHLNARPPGWLASGGLLAAYLISLSMAAVFAGVCIVGPRGDLSRLDKVFAPKGPTRVLACDDWETWRGRQWKTNSASSSVIVVANYLNPADAAERFQSMPGSLPDHAAVTRFGSSVFLQLPAGDKDARRSWYDLLREQTKDVFTVGTNSATSMALSFRAPDFNSAAALEKELNEYFASEFSRMLIPPWHPSDSRSAAERQAHQLARATYLLAQSQQDKIFEDARLRDFQQRINAARRRGDDDAAAALRTEMTGLYAEVDKERLEALEKQGGASVDPAVIDLMKQHSLWGSRTYRNARKQASEELVRRMGRLPGSEENSSFRGERLSALGGNASTKGQTVLLSWVSFARIEEGGPALAGWLCSRGCTELKYKLTNEASELDDEE